MHTVDWPLSEDLLSRISDKQYFFTVLEDFYRAPWRKFHTIERVDHLLRRLEQTKRVCWGSNASTGIAQYWEIELAIVLHLATYVPGAHNNAQLAELLLSGLVSHTLCEPDGTTMRRHPTWTRLSLVALLNPWSVVTQRECRTLPECYVADLAMEVLSASPALYREYTQHLWEEYALFMPRKEYEKLRRGFLLTVKDKCKDKALFSTEYFQAFNNFAICNVDDELSELLKEAFSDVKSTTA